MKKVNEKIRKRGKRKMSIRKRIKCGAERPRMTIYKSNHYTYVQVIDDIKGVTLATASNLEKEFKSIKNNVKDIVKLGQAIGEHLKKKKITKVAFDRNGYLFHGIVKSVADGARKAGIKF